MRGASSGFEASASVSEGRSVYFHTQALFVRAQLEQATSQSGCHVRSHRDMTQKLPSPASPSEHSNDTKDTSIVLCRLWHSTDMLGEYVHF